MIEPETVPQGPAKILLRRQAREVKFYRKLLPDYICLALFTPRHTVNTERKPNHD